MSAWSSGPYILRLNGKLALKILLLAVISLYCGKNWWIWQINFTCKSLLIRISYSYSYVQLIQQYFSLQLAHSLMLSTSKIFLHTVTNRKLV